MFVWSGGNRVASLACLWCWAMRCVRECMHTNNDNRRMCLKAAHIDKDAQDLSRVIVSTRRQPTRAVQRAAIAHSYILNYNERSTRPHPSVSSVSPNVFVCKSLSASASSGLERCICCLNQSYYLNWMLDRCRNELVSSVFLWGLKT